MMEELKIYKEITEAIKKARSNIELESDFEELNIDEKTLETELLQDNEVQELAKNKVLKNGNKWR